MLQRAWSDSPGTGLSVPQAPQGLLAHTAQGSANEMQHQQWMCLPRASSGPLQLLIKANARVILRNTSNQGLKYNFSFYWKSGLQKGLLQACPAPEG